MDNWQIVCKVKDAVPDNEDGWQVMDFVWALLDGAITRAEAVEALAGLVEDPEALLREVGA